MITPAMGSALSGLNAASKRIETSANNIVNQSSTQSRDAGGVVSNKPYQPRDTSQVTRTDGTVETVDRNREPASQAVYNPADAAANDNGVVQYPNVDLAEEVVKMKIATYDFKANLTVIHSESKRLGDLLDILS